MNHVEKVKTPVKRLTRAIIGMVVGAVIYSIGIVFLIELGGFYSGGVSGFSQIIASLVSIMKYGVQTAADGTKSIITIPGITSIMMIIINVPMLIISAKGVSKRFAILSVASIGIQTLLIWLLEMIPSSANPFNALAKDPLTLAVIGGILTGAGGGISLRYGASGGGTDTLSQYLSFKKSTSFAAVSLSIDFIVVLSASLIGSLALGQGLSVACYTVVRMIISILVLDKIHTGYHYLRITIVTTKKDEMSDALTSHFPHGVTVFNSIGAFTHQTRYTLETIITAYEKEDYLTVIRSVDKDAFVSFSGVDSISGNFTKKAMT